MAGQSFIAQNQIPNEVDHKDLLALHRKQILIDANCHHVGTIESFDTTTQLASVKLVYKQTIFLPNAATGGYSPTLVDYPLSVDCPVIFLGGGPAKLTFPIAKGDECLLLFNDRDIDNWFSGAANGPVATPRLHAFADAIALVGLRSLANTIIDFDADRAVLSYGQAKIAVGASDASVEFGDNTLKVSADKLTVTFGTTVLTLTAAGKFSVENGPASELVTALYTLLSTGSAGGFPFVLDPTALAALESFKV